MWLRSLLAHLSIKEMYKRSNCVEALKHSGMYEAGASIFWLDVLSDLVNNVDLQAGFKDVVECLSSFLTQLAFVFLPCVCNVS